MEWQWFHLPAAAGAAAHFYFAFIETYGWTPETVKRLAPSWFEGLKDSVAAEHQVAWAKRFAFNMGAYNLMLAIGLGWTLWADPSIGRQLAIFFGIWLLVAAAAARYIRVVRAFYSQGILGVLLLATAIWLRSAI